MRRNILQKKDFKNGGSLEGQRILQKGKPLYGGPILTKVVGLLVAFLLFVGCAGYKPNPSMDEITAGGVEKHGIFYLYGEREELGFIIYPGGKVDPLAYAPLSSSLHAEGYTTAIVSFPFDLGIFGSGRASRVIQDNPRIDKWVIIGHSLGGVAGSIFAAKHPEKLDGVVFLASYPYKDLSEIPVWALLITATEDKVLNWADYDESREHFPKQYQELVIHGGNHSGFGYYGEQKGDGENLIGREEQHRQVVQAILEYVE